MAYLIIIVISLISALAFIGAMHFIVIRQRAVMRGSLKSLEQEVSDKSSLRDQFRALYGRMVSLISVADLIKTILALQASLKAERGRITITQTELETVENRLCELEEIERELEASNLETKEELNILKKKEAELRDKNDSLKKEIATSTSQLDEVIQELEVSTKVQEQFDNMKAELVMSEQKCEVLISQIEEINEQYFQLKMRYDALDIEYAQLYEKFADAEAMIEERAAE